MDEGYPQLMIKIIMLTKVPLTHLRLLYGFNRKFKGENNERGRSWGTLLSSYHFESKGAC